MTEFAVKESLRTVCSSKAVTSEMVLARYAKLMP